VLLGLSCSEFIEPSLEDKKISLNSPSDRLESNKYNQTFWWEPADGVSTYRIQVAIPSFDSIAEIVADSLVKGNKLSLSLEPGRYEWRVRAENSGSKGIYTTRRFTIYESSISNQRVQLKSPGNGTVSNQRELKYSWHSLFGTDVYRLQIDTNNFSDDSLLVLNAVTPNVEFLVNLNADKQYQWRVRAENDTAVSKWSVIHSVIIDATPPVKVGLTSPAAGQIVSKRVSLQWGAVSGAAKYQLMIYKSDGVTPYNGTFPLTLNANNYSFNEGDFNETLNWKVRAVDAAGNVGAYSDVRNFTVQ
jgi:uncharacterized protein YegP (UPF0339 family)